ncbi:MAG: D-alanine--D-alanine ligase, partial [Bacteroidota bacterium]
MEKIRVGIFFGGRSREREVSFAGGRTVFDNLDKSIFEAIPIFVDSLGNFIQLNWEYIYKGSIRDFYPAPAALPELLPEALASTHFQIYVESLPVQDIPKELLGQVGTPLSPPQFKEIIDMAFLALHGPYGEDGNIQGLLEWYDIPYTGSGILPSAIGIDKIIQDQWLSGLGFSRPKSRILKKSEWLNTEKASSIFEALRQELGLPLVIKAPHQGSSIGVNILKSPDVTLFQELVNKSFFIQEIDLLAWVQKSEAQKKAFLIEFTDIRVGLGFPVHVLPAEENRLNPHHYQTLYHPQELKIFLDQAADQHPNGKLFLQAEDSEEQVLIESFISGKEFSCIVIQDEDGRTIALPPTEIRKYQEVYDYRSKYLPGTSHKVTPIELPEEQIQAIREACADLYNRMGAQVYARIDGFINDEGHIHLNDPNTTSGMMPSSFFFHQAAEIGLDASNFLTYLIRSSIQERINSGKQNLKLRKLLGELDQTLEGTKQAQEDKTSVAVIMGGYSTERHISMESGRNIYEKLASSGHYQVIPIFLTGHDAHYELFVLPIHYMLKDNADDIRDKILKTKSSHPIIEKIKEEAQHITYKYAGKPLMFPKKISLDELKDRVDAVFIALHGRPGEDGSLQVELEKRAIPYNGSGIPSSRITINKFETNELLKKAGFSVAQHRLVHQEEWKKDAEKIILEIEAEYQFPLIAKPADDGCSSAVKKIKDATSFRAFAEMMFRPSPPFLEEEAQILDLKINEEFPQKSYFLVEELIEAQGAKYFLEITGGLLTH